MGVIVKYRHLEASAKNYPAGVSVLRQTYRVGRPEEGASLSRMGRAPGWLPPEELPSHRGLCVVQGGHFL